MDWLIPFYLGGVVATLAHSTWAAFVNEETWLQWAGFAVFAFLWPVHPVMYLTYYLRDR